MGLPFEDLENGNGQTTSYGSGNPKFILDSLSASPYNSANKLRNSSELKKFIAWIRKRPPEFLSRVKKSAR